MTRSELPPTTGCGRALNGNDSDGDRAVVWLRGEHDLATKVSVMDSIASVTQREDTDVVVDLSAVTFMDASTIGALIEARNRLRTQSHSLEVRAPSSRTSRLLDLCGLADLVHPAPTGAPHVPGAAVALGPDLPSLAASG